MQWYQNDRLPCNRLGGSYQRPMSTMSVFSYEGGIGAAAEQTYCSYQPPLALPAAAMTYAAAAIVTLVNLSAADAPQTEPMAASQLGHVAHGVSLLQTMLQIERISGTPALARSLSGRCDRMANFTSSGNSFQGRPPASCAALLLLLLPAGCPAALPWDSSSAAQVADSIGEGGCFRSRARTSC